MNLFSLFPLMGNLGGGEGSTPGSILTSLMPLGFIIVIFYFLIIRPQNKKQKETQNMLSNLKKGDKVVTVGGIHGVIQNVKERSVIVKVDEFTKIEFARQAIASVTPDEKGDKSEKSEKSDKKKAEITAEASEASDEDDESSEESKN